MKKGLLLIHFLLILNCVVAQNPIVVHWEKRFGGTAADWLSSFLRTPDGGYLMGGYSNSGPGGDKSQANWGGFDYWVVKTDSIGNKLWDRRYGGTLEEELNYMINTSDGGCLLGGKSQSGISGNKTEGNRDSTLSSFDFWLVKLDDAGNIEWDKRFGGTDEEWQLSMIETPDGGYLAGGGSGSDAGGDKSQDSWGAYDFWVIKMDSLGNKQWDKDFGGTSGERLEHLILCSDGNYLLGGVSSSGIGGDKTQPCWGGTDYWIVKIDTAGNKIWDKRYGGNSNDRLYKIQQTADGGFLLGGLSGSDANGDKSQTNFGLFINVEDYWMVKIDSAGVKQWDKVFGGTLGEDEFGNINILDDGGYLVSGNSYSNISGNKTENNDGQEQSWIVKMNTFGIKEWDKTLFTDGHDEACLIVPNGNFCFTAAVATNSGIGGYKSEPNWDITKVTYDYWIIYFCDSAQTVGNSFPINQNPIKIYPNPFDSQINIALPNSKNSNIQLRVKNLAGQIVWERKEKNESPSLLKVDLGFLSKGIYFFEFISDQNYEVAKIVKQM